MATNEQQALVHPPRPHWNARETAIVLSLGLILLSVAIDFMVDEQFDWRAFLAELPPNIMGALIVFWLFEFAYSRRQQEEQKAQETKEATEQLKRDLIMRMGSRVNDTAVSAADELLERGWLRDGSLKGVNLIDANLQGANLINANLQGVVLGGANLFGALLAQVDLQEGRLGRTNLQGADCWNADLKRAEFWLANLKGANLERANLQGASFLQANLQEVELSEAWFSENTELPDGTYWTPDTDMTRFTDPNHPNFWRPEPGSVWWYR